LVFAKWRLYPQAGSASFVPFDPKVESKKSI
jgi:hypothetical protein